MSREIKFIYSYCLVHRGKVELGPEHDVIALNYPNREGHDIINLTDKSWTFQNGDVLIDITHLLS